ncbi:UNVERIFIED_ORG: hypothetical protein J2W85_003122 [Ensifer adhaerens]|nr:hypothetical protein [Ensifer adhaerens]
MRLMQRREIGEFFDRRDVCIVEPDRPLEAIAAMNDTMAGSFPPDACRNELESRR